MADQLVSPMTPEIERNLAEFAEDSAPVLAALAAAGHRFADLQDLLRLKVFPKEIVPILLEWLPRVALSNVKETIVRALTDRAAKPLAARPLLAEFARTSEDKSPKWSMGYAMTVVADDSVFGEIAKLAEDPKHGKARGGLVMALGKSRDPRASAVLVRLLADEQLIGHALVTLGKRADPSTREHIVPLLGHPNAYLRKEAKSALAKIDQRAAAPPSPQKTK